MELKAKLFHPSTIQTVNVGFLSYKFSEHKIKLFVENNVSSIAFYLFFW